MEHPLVSVITSCYNHEKYVEESILSVINQTYKNIQLIVLDDGSRDSSPEIIESLQKKYGFTFIKQQNMGLPGSLNKAITNYVKGDYIKLVASDDKLPLDSIETHVNYLNKNPNVSMCFANAYKMDDQGKVIGHIYGVDPSKFKDKYKEYCLGNIHFNTTTVMFKTDTFNKVGLYDETIPTEDIFMNRKIFKTLQVGYVNKPVAFYRTHSNNSTVDNWGMYINSKSVYELNKGEDFYNEGLRKKHLQWFYTLSKDYKKEALKYLPSAAKKFYSKLFIAGLFNLIGLSFISSSIIKTKRLLINAKSNSRSIKKPLKQIYSSTFSLLVRLFGKNKNADQGIFIFSFPRSGSTWFMNLIQASPKRVGIFEPYFEKENSYAIPFFENDVLYNNNKLVQYNFKNINDQLLKGKLLTRWSTNHSKKNKYFSSTSVVIKLLRANYLLSWFNQNYTKNRKIILVRHPGAVISSMKRSPGGWHNPSKEYFNFCSKVVFNHQYDELINTCKENFEFMAIYYGMAIKALLQDFDKNKMNLLVTYEELLLKDPNTFDRLEAFLEEKLTTKFYGALNLVSKTSNSNSSLKSKDPIVNWMKELTDYEKSRIQEILSQFQITIYHMDNIMPDKNVISEINCK